MRTEYALLIVAVVGAIATLAVGSALAQPPDIEITEPDGTVHLVTDAESVQGHRAGKYLARCGKQVYSASLSEPGLRRCTGCWGEL